MWYHAFEAAPYMPTRGRKETKKGPIGKAHLVLALSLPTSLAPRPRLSQTFGVVSAAPSVGNLDLFLQECGHILVSDGIFLAGDFGTMQSFAIKNGTACVCVFATLASIS